MSLFPQLFKTDSWLPKTDGGVGGSTGIPPNRMNSLAASQVDLSSWVSNTPGQDFHRINIPIVDIDVEAEQHISQQTNAAVQQIGRGRFGASHRGGMYVLDDGTTEMFVPLGAPQRTKNMLMSDLKRMERILKIQLRMRRKLTSKAQ